MRLLVDNADVSKIKTMFEYFPVSGVTTNPSILTKSGKKPYEVLHEIRELIGPDMDLHVQVLSQRAEEMVREAEIIKKEFGANTYVKIPVTREGIKAIGICAAEFGYITATAIYTTTQAYLAAEAGADYVAPYVNRIDNLGQDGVDTVQSIQDILDNYDGETQLLAASFKNVRQIMALAEYGVYSATVSPDLIEQFLVNASVDHAVAQFKDDIDRAYGADYTMLTERR